MIVLYFILKSNINLSKSRSTERNCAVSGTLVEFNVHDATSCANPVCPGCIGDGCSPVGFARSAHSELADRHGCGWRPWHELRTPGLERIGERGRGTRAGVAGLCAAVPAARDGRRRYEVDGGSRRADRASELAGTVSADVDAGWDYCVAAGGDERPALENAAQRLVDSERYGAAAITVRAQFRAGCYQRG